MRMQAMKLLLMSLLGVALGPANSFGDTLYEYKNPIKIGHGIHKGQTIIWKTCSDQDDGQYVQPPFSFEQTENCNVGPPTFGLECQEERCKVVDEEKTQKFIPDARNGEKLSLHIDQRQVTLTYRGKTTTINH